MAKRKVPQTTTTCLTCGQRFQHLRWRKRRRYCSLECHYQRPINYISLFWSKVHKTNECWVWTAAKSHGYGVAQVAKGKDDLAHRFSYELANGPIPEGLFVCHRCDNPTCVNPEHLFLGTATDNMNDAASKGRTQQGEKHWGAKLDNQRVLAIRAEHLSANLTQRQIALKYGVCYQTVNLIVLRKIWKHLP